MRNSGEFINRSYTDSKCKKTKNRRKIWLRKDARPAGVWQRKNFLAKCCIFFFNMFTEIRRVLLDGRLIHGGLVHVPLKAPRGP